MNLDMERLLDAIRRVESNGNANAISPKGAKGPYQFMDATAAEYGVENPFDEKQSRDGARRYMTALLKQFDGSVEMALAAYNGGPGRLARRGSIAAMPQESQDYVAKVMNHYQAGVITANAGQTDKFLTPKEDPASILQRLAPGRDAIRRRALGALAPFNNEDLALQASVLQPKPVNQAQRIYEMQLRTGLPVGLIERNLDKIEEQTKRADFDAAKFRKESPLLAEWLTKNPVRAALAQDDYDSLTMTEKLWETMKAIPGGLEQGVLQERYSTLSYKAVKGTITPKEQIERDKLKIQIGEIQEQFSEGVPWATRAAANILGMQFGAMGGRARSMVESVGIDIFTPAGGSRMLMSAAEHDYGMAVGEAYSDLEDARDADGNPIDPVAARYAAMLVAVPNTMLEYLSLSKALKVIPGVSSVIGKLSAKAMGQILVKPTVAAALADFGKKYAVAVGTETFTEGMQKFLNIISREIATGDYGEGFTGEDVEAIGAEMAEVLAGSSILGVLGSGPKVMEIYHQMDKAAKTEQFMRSLGEVTAESKTYANSPKAFGEYISHLKENGPVKNVFIPIEQWDALFQDKAPDAAKEVFGNLEQYSEAKATSGDLVIPIETYAEKLAGTQFHEQLVPHSRLNAGDMTPTEAAEAQKLEPQIIETLKKEMEDQVKKEAPLQAVYEDVYNKLRGVGIGATEANRDATLWRERLRARAERLGVDPLELYNEQPLVIQRQLPTLPDQLISYNQQLAEPPVPFAEKLPLEGGEINLPPATQQEVTAAEETVKAATASEQEYGVFGATIHPGKGDLAGTEGVAVAGYPQRGVVTDGAPTAADLEIFMRRNRDIFQADPNAALGVWVDSESGKGYIDITNVLPRDLAIKQGEYLGEKAVWDLQAFEEIRLPVKADAGQGVLFQGERGASVPARNMIALLKGADPSTFVHESGHLWLEELRQDALRPDAPEQLRNDWETIKVWSGATDEAISTESHEMFARGLEAYIMEGKAPSFQLREIFSQFMNWMMRIYKNLNMLGVDLNPEVHDVMDRLIATDEAIKYNREHNDYHQPLFDQSMMTEAEYGQYRQLNDEAKSQAEDTFRAKVMKELRREKLQSWRDEKKALTPKVRDEILADPVYKAAYWLWSGKLPDGSVIPDMAATKLDKQALLDMGVTLSDLPFRYQNDGLHPDVVAQLFGFKSGESLVRELVGLPNLKDAINDEVNRRIREAHGGTIIEGTTMEEAAMEVQNTRQLDVFNMELRILKRLGSRREATHPAVLKDIARQMIARKKLKYLNPKVYEEAAYRAGQDAQNAMLGREFRTGTGRNLDLAFDAKQRQILNIHLFREATKQKQMAERSIKKWKKFLFRSDQRLAKTYNMDMVGAARAIASVHGIGGSPEVAASYMSNLQKYDEQSYNDLKDIVEMASSDGRKVEDLTVDDFSIIKDAIEGLWASALRSRQIEIDGVLMQRDHAVNELGTRIGQLVKPGRKRAGYDRAVTKWEKTKVGTLGALALLRRVEHWVDAMDSGDPNGVFRKYIWQPISEAADAYRDNRRIMLEKYVELVKQFPKEAAKAGKIDAYELGYVFGNKAELLGALAHSGNLSNLQKMLIAGRGTGKEWGVFNAMGDLDTSKWDAFIKRMQDTGVLTKADYDFIQGVWDLFEELKPQAQKAHKEMYGYYFNEITAHPIITPFGTYRGGYYPASADPFIVEDAQIRREREAVESQASSFMFPTTGRGFTKKRSEMYNRPLTLDLGLVPQQMEKVLRFIHLEPKVKDVGRIVTDHQFRNNLGVLDSSIASVMLMPWLQRSALQLVEQPSGPRLAWLDKAFHSLRTNTAMQFMAVHASVALQQFTGLSLAVVKVKPNHLGRALWIYTHNPEQYVAQIREASSFMRNRTSTQLIDIRRSIDNILLNPNAYQKAKSFADEHVYFMQIATQNVVDVVTWGGAYEQATKAGYDEKTAVRIADSTVRETQGTFAPEDVSRIEAGPAYLRLFTMFYSFFNMAANLNATEFVKARREGGFSGFGRGLYVYTFGFMIPAVLAEAIVQLMSGEALDDDDEDGYLDNLLSIFFGGQARMGTAMVPAVGQAVQVGINMHNDKWYDDRITTSPAVSAIESLSRVGLGYHAKNLLLEDDTRIKRPMQDLFTTIGLITGLPVAPLAKPLGYLSDVEQGYIEETDNPVEFTRGLVSGRAPQ